MDPGGEESAQSRLVTAVCAEEPDPPSRARLENDGAGYRVALFEPPHWDGGAPVLAIRAALSKGPPGGHRHLSSFDRPIFQIYFYFFGLSWETSTFSNYHSEDSGDPGSRTIELSLKSASFLY